MAVILVKYSIKLYVNKSLDWEITNLNPHAVSYEILVVRQTKIIHINVLDKINL